MNNKMLSFFAWLPLLASSPAFSIDSVAIGKELFECSRSYGDEPKTFTDCKLLPHTIFAKTDYALKYELTYSFPCKGGQLNFGLAVGDGNEKSFHRFIIGSEKKAITYEGKGPIVTHDNRPDNTFGAMFVGKCSVKVDSAKVSLSDEYLKLFNDRLDIITLLGTIQTLTQNLDLNAQTLGTLLTKADLGSLHTLIRGVRNNLDATIKAKEGSTTEPPNSEAIKALKITLLDLDTTICTSPILREKNMDICQGIDELADKTVTDTEAAIRGILTNLQQQSATILSDVTSALTNNVQKIWDLTGLVDESQRDELRKNTCTRIKTAGLKSSNCPEIP